MARIGLTLSLIAGILSTYGYELVLAKQVAWNIADEARISVNNQEQDELDLPENAFPMENMAFPYSCHEDGLFPYPKDCTLGVRCMGGINTIFSCTDVLHFNNVTKKCENFCSARCDPLLACVCGWNSCEKSTEVSPTEDDEISDSEENKWENSYVCQRDGLFAHPGHCNQYIQCLHGRPSFKMCPSGLHFRKKTKTCDVPCIAKCDPKISCKQKSNQILATESSIPDETDIPESEAFPNKVFTLRLKFVCFDDGLFPHSKDCSKYVNCSSGTSYEQSCPPGKHFNSETKRCELPCSAKCDPNILCGWRKFKNKYTEMFIKEAEDFLCSKDTAYANPITCEAYFVCKNGVVNAFLCPGGQHFNNKTEKCEEPCDAHCDPSIAEECGWGDTTKDEKKILLKQPVFDFQCPENGLFANIACENFIQCTGGQAYLINCPQGQHYNYDSQQCTTPCEARCLPNYEDYCTDEAKQHSPKSLLKDFDCQTDGYHVDPLDCGSFIQCFRGSAYAIACPDGLHYSPTLEICMTPCEAKCAPNYEEYCRNEEWNRRRRQFSRSNSVKQPFPLVSEYICTKDGLFPNPEECTSYIQCITGESFVKPCPEGLHFNEKTQECESPCDAHCDFSIGDTCGWEESWAPSEDTTFNYEVFLATNSPSLMYHFTCVKDGIYKNPENCSTYIQCVGGHSYLMACPEGLHFNEQNRRCDYPCDAHCDSNLACDCSWETCGQNEEIFDEVDCEAEPVEGTCTDRIRRYAYDSWSGRCRGFIYGGCGGNSNNFKTMDECENKCQKKLLKGFRCPEDTGMFGHYPDCVSYYHCKKGIATLKKCPKGKAFDHKKSKCVTEYEATCVYMCRDKDAVYPYEEDCRKYIDCVNGISKLEKCPQGKAFDPIEKDCADEKLVENCFWSEN